MINHYSVVSGSWTQITQAGESGVCYLKAGGVQGDGDCVVFHTSGTPTLDDVQYAYPVYEPKGQNKCEIISADSDSDVYYAIANKNGGVCVIITDVI